MSIKSNIFSISISVPEQENLIEYLKMVQSIISRHLGKESCLKQMKYTGKVYKRSSDSDCHGIYWEIELILNDDSESIYPDMTEWRSIGNELRGLFDRPKFFTMTWIEGEYKKFTVHWLAGRPDGFGIIHPMKYFDVNKTTIDLFCNLQRLFL